MATAFACRSETLPVWPLTIRGNLFVVGAVVAELLLLAASFPGLPPLARLLGDLRLRPSGGLWRWAPSP
jgi:hypothetical protein